MEELANKYNPAEVESKWYEYWLKYRIFTPDIVLVPPATHS